MFMNGVGTCGVQVSKKAATQTQTLDQGLSPYQAIKQYSDPDLWFEHRALSAPHGHLLSLVSERAREIRDKTYPSLWPKNAQRIWFQLRQSFEGCLVSGELVGTGYVNPMGLEDSPTIIPADKWSVLDLNYQKATANGGGLTITGIRIFRADAAQVAAKHKKVGRPSCRDEIKTAYETLRDDEKVDYAARLNCLFEPIRAKVREMRGDPGLTKGLGDQAIRICITPLFEEDKQRIQKSSGRL